MGYKYSPSAIKPILTRATPDGEIKTITAVEENYWRASNEDGVIEAITAAFGPEEFAVVSNVRVVCDYFCPNIAITVQTDMGDFTAVVPASFSWTRKVSSSGVMLCQTNFDRDGVIIQVPGKMVGGQLYPYIRILEAIKSGLVRFFWMNEQVQGVYRGGGWQDWPSLGAPAE